MTIQPHIAQARAVCLRASVDVRTSAETPQQIIARAQVFEAYVLGDNPDPGAGQGAGKANGKSRQHAGQPQA